MVEEGDASAWAPTPSNAAAMPVSAKCDLGRLAAREACLRDHAGKPHGRHPMSRRGSAPHGASRILRPEDYPHTTNITGAKPHYLRDPNRRCLESPSGRAVLLCARAGVGPIRR